MNTRVPEPGRGRGNGARVGRRFTPGVVLALLLIAPDPVATGAAERGLARAAPAARERAEPLDRWHAIRLAGEHAGWMHERVERRDGVITTRTEMRLAVRRGRTEVEVGFRSRFRETPEGEPISMVVRRRTGRSPVEQRFEFGEGDGGRIKVTTRRGGSSSTSMRERPEGRWLPPAAGARYVARRIEAGAAEITVRTIDPFVGIEPVTITRRHLEPTTVEVMGRTVEAIRCDVEQSAAPGITSVEYLGRDGRPIRSETRIGSMRAVIVAADEALARARVSPPELMERTFVDPGGSIEEPRAARRGVYRLSTPDGDLPGLLDGGVQRVERLEDGGARVIVDLDRAVPADGADREGLLASTRMLPADDAKIRALVRRATRGVPEGEPGTRARAMRRFVHEYVREKSLGVGFAGAGEVARTREGDCTEHAVLLGAMLRADGIPARVVSGLIYADAFAGHEGIFGYHMWTQALIEADGDGGGDGARWLDLDATLPPEAPFDAAHIALSASAFRDGESANALIGLTPLLGRLEIEIESIQ